ncbi:hypothetical protein BUALT_Bualt14G0077700 [Buddleja alternifolia]|uniref:SAGA-associated factor 11 n=1 Tax=Buddleja alternifolia TaxID=168488 RepID=A0AAV6WQG7_9LAMI|nr:hypothetical protein BUALT_Bualt14G0077700 [Buddleja alternifolia]
MVHSIGIGRMATLARLLDAGSVSQNVTEEVGYQKLASEYIRRQLQDADEANLLDEADMHIFGLRPMTDPLDLVCCNACKKPIRASKYTAHAELCKSLREELILELDSPAVNKKPPRKERKKLPIARTNKATPLGEPKYFKPLASDYISASESYMNEQNHMTPFAEAKQNRHLDATHKMNGSGVSPYSTDCSGDVTLHSPKPPKRTAAENPSNPGTKNLCTSGEVLPYAPAPLASKIYYSQRNHNLRRAIRHMFYEEWKESSTEVSKLEALQVNAVPTQTPSPSIFHQEQVANQQRDDQVLHLPQTSSNFHVDKSGGFVPSMNVASHLPVNNTLGPHYMSNSYSFAGKSGNSLGAVQQGSGSVPVV